MSERPVGPFAFLSIHCGGNLAIKKGHHNGRRHLYDKTYKVQEHRTAMSSDIPFPVPPSNQGLNVTSGDRKELGTLFHRLNNQLGIILANAELLEARAKDDDTGARAGQIVAGAVEAIAAVKDIRTHYKRQQV